MEREESAIMMGKMSRFVLVFYVLLMFKPVMPLLADMFAHTFNEQQHILLVHEVNGKFHIHQELGNASHQSDNEKSNEVKVEVEEYMNVLPEIFKVLLPALTVGKYLSYTDYPISAHRDTHYPPPKYSAMSIISGVNAMEIGFGLVTNIGLSQ